MKQFLLTEEPDKDRLVRLRGEDYHYLVNVRRLKPGDVFNALLPCGKNIDVTVISAENHTLCGRIVDTGYDPNTNEPENTVPIILFQALPKGSKMDLIVRQAAETGVSEIIPFISEHTISKLKAIKEQKKERIDRWRRIIKEARQQSGSAADTHVLEPLSMDEMFAYWEKLQNKTSEKALGLVFSPDIKPAERPILCDPLEKDSFHRYLYTIPPLIVLAIGPEGGFSGEELSRFASAGFKQLSLGSAILRTETAALFGAAAVKIILMERSWWTLKQQ